MCFFGYSSIYYFIPLKLTLVIFTFNWLEASLRFLILFDIGKTRCENQNKVKFKMVNIFSGKGIHVRLQDKLFIAQNMASIKAVLAPDRIQCKLPIN